MRAGCFSVAVMDYFENAGLRIPGGNALNQAAHLAGHGWRSAFIGAVGNDADGDAIEECLTKAGVDASALYRCPGNTACNRIKNDESGERFGVDGAWDGGVYSSFRLSGSDWEFLGNCDLVVTHSDCPDFPALLGTPVKDRFLAVDFLHSEDYGLMLESARFVDILYSGGHPGMIDQLQAVAHKSDALMVLTLGSAGSIAFYGHDVFRQAALPVGKVLDTTGCGDAFQAAFTNTFFRSRDVKASLLAGARAGAAATSHYGSLKW